MSTRLDRSWRVVASHENVERDRCVDVFVRPGGLFGFEEFRRDPEDMGSWTPVAYFATREFFTADDALDAARHSVAWLRALGDP